MQVFTPKEPRKITQKNRKLAGLLRNPQVASWRLLMSAYQVNYSIFEEAISAEGLSYARFQILYLLYFEGATSASCLAQHLFVSRANMSTFCKRLEKDNLVKQVAVKKGSKRTEYVLTKGGNSLFEKIFVAHIRRVKKSIPAFTLKTTSELKNITRNHECKEDYFDN